VKLRLAKENRRSKWLWLFAAIGALFVVAFLVIATAAIAWNIFSLRTATKWFMRSQRYKSEVLAQSGGTAGELKHIEWDGWGWAGQDTTVYLVFDSTDSLSMAAANHAPGKFNGIPCEVAQVRQLESHWYTVQFYTNEFWGRRNALDCRGVGG
jgi:uncharacterized iron-regulated membrane protein